MRPDDLAPLWQADAEASDMLALLTILLFVGVVLAWAGLAVTV